MPRSKDKKERSYQPTFMVYLKVGFLLALAVFGMIVLFRMSEGIASSKQSEPETVKAIKGIQQTLTGDEIAKAIDKEIRTNETYKSTLNTALKKTEDVLGEAVKFKDQTIQNSKNYVTDYLYEQTTGSMIEGLLENLPERQKERVLDNICK